MKNLKQLLNYIEDLVRQRDLAYQRFGSLENQAIMLDQITYELQVDPSIIKSTNEIKRLQREIKIGRDIKVILGIYRNLILSKESLEQH